MNRFRESLRIYNALKDSFVDAYQKLLAGQIPEEELLVFCLRAREAYPRIVAEEHRQHCQGWFAHIVGITNAVFRRDERRTVSLALDATPPVVTCAASDLEYLAEYVDHVLASD